MIDRLAQTDAWYGADDVRYPIRDMSEATLLGTLKAIRESAAYVQVVEVQRLIEVAASSEAFDDQERYTELALQVSRRETRAWLEHTPLVEAMVAEIERRESEAADRVVEFVRESVLAALRGQN